jgi:glycerophosphoryl diester phosphodiesterase
VTGIFLALPQPVVFAHRGASAHAPENTLVAFQLAFEQGAPAIEFDVKLTADGRVVVIHDATVDRTTNGTGRVSRLPLAALQELDAGSWRSAQFRGEKIPSLDQVFEALGKKLLMNVELTNYEAPFDALVPKVADLVKKHGLENYVWFSSFFPHNLMRMAQLLPPVPRGQLIWPGPGGWWQRAWGTQINVQAEHPWKDDVTAAYVQSAHKRGRRIHVWTVNQPDDLRRLQALEVDGVFTDDPITALDILKPQ